MKTKNVVLGENDYLTISIDRDLDSPSRGAVMMVVRKNVWRDGEKTDEQYLVAVPLVQGTVIDGSTARAGRNAIYGESS